MYAVRHGFVSAILVLCQNKNKPTPAAPEERFCLDVVMLILADAFLRGQGVLLILAPK